MASILVVEDELIVAMDLQSVLLEMGYVVTAVVPSGEEAIEAAARRKPDLVLMDIMLRGHIDGVTTARLMREMFRIPVIVLTAYADAASVERAKLSEPFGYLLKPFEERELRSAIEVALHKHAMEARLEESRKELEEIVQAIPDAVVILRGDAIHFVNAAWVSLLGYDGPYDFLGRSIGAFLDASERDSTLSWLRSAEEPGVAPREIRYRGRNGEVVVLEAAPVPLAQAHGGPALLLIGRDVTARKRMHARMALTDRLVAVGTIAAGVAHEINNPLSYVMTNVELCTNEIEALVPELERLEATLGASGSNAGEAAAPRLALRLQALEQNLRDALAGAVRVASIVRDLVTFARASADRRAPVDLPRLIGAMLRLIWNEIRPRARLVEHYHEVPAVDAAEDRLGQVFLNLLLNAAQAIAPGHAAENEIRVVTRTDEAGCAVVEIEDTGCGIRPEIVPRIFDPFFTTKPVGSGTGLGLSICHGIVESLGGHIEVESEPGRGSLFRVVLLPAPAPSPELIGLRSAGAGPRRRGRVLVVDDEPLVLALFERLLGADHDLVSTSAARAALERLEGGERFDVILCDLMMPEMTGMDLYRELMRLAPEQAERIIFITGGAFTPLARAFLDRVANPRIMKPFQLRQLVDLVASKVLEARGWG
jgi:PAS domain S-box-containing protein